MILMGCASTRIFETTLDSSSKVTGGTLKAAHDEDIPPFLSKFCNGKYDITNQKLVAEKEGFLFVYYWNYKYVDFRCEK